MLIRPVRQPSPPMPIKVLVSGWQMYKCFCCGTVCRRWVERGELVDVIVTGYCPKSSRSERMELYGNATCNEFKHCGDRPG